MQHNHQSILSYLNQKSKVLLLLLVLGFLSAPSLLAQSGSGSSDPQPPAELSNEQLTEWNSLVQSYQASEQRQLVLEQRLSSYENSMRRTLERLGILTTLLMDSQTDLGSSRASLEGLRENLQQLESGLLASQEQLILTQQELETSRQESENLKVRLVDLEASLQGTEESLTALSTELTQVTSEYESLSTRYQALQTRLTASLETIDRLEARIDELTARLDAAEALIESLRLDLKDAEKEQQAAFWKGIGVGAGGTGAIVLVIWLISSLAP